MKNLIRFTLHRVACPGVLVLFGLLSGHSLLAGDAKTAIATTADEPIYSNWINLTLGGLILRGNEAEFQRQNPGLNGPIFGGIDDMHLEKSLGKALVTVDARAIFANSDYKVKIELSQPDLGYINVGFTEFATYSNGNGGYLPGTDLRHDGLFFSGPEYTLYRGSIWVEAGLRVPNFPELTFRYEHAFRNGQKDSTSWGGINTGTVATPTNSNVRKILPSFYNINETRDIFTFDAKHLLGKPEQFGNTEVKLGMRYEFDNTKNSLNFQNIANPSTTPIANNFNNIPKAAASYYATNADQLSLALYDGHISSVTRFGDKLWMTAAFSYSAASSDISGSRIGGPAYGVPFAPYYNNRAYANVPREAYIDLGGGSNFGSSVAILNFMWMPLDCLTISPSIRMECTNTTSSSSFIEELPQVAVPGTTTTKTVNGKKVTTVTAARLVTPAQAEEVPALVNSHVFLTDISESLQIRYTGIKNLVLYAECDWDQQYESRGDVTPAGSVAPNSDTKLNLSANNQILVQKYSVGANWYAMPGLNAALQYYLQFQDIGQNINSDDPARANQRLVSQFWTTNDVNARLTWQPLPSLSVVSRYDFQRTIVDSQWAGDPANSALGLVAPYGQSSIMTNNMITESVTWQPLDRLYLQGSLSYVLNTTSSGASLYTQAITSSQNNYWTAGAGFGFAIDPKTELRGDFAFYSANNYVNNAQFGVPYGAGATQYSFSASLNRQITKNVSLAVKYYMETYRDQLSGGNNNFTGQMITSSLQMRF